MEEDTKKEFLEQIERVNIICAAENLTKEQALKRLEIGKTQFNKKCTKLGYTWDREIKQIIIKGGQATKVTQNVVQATKVTQNVVQATKTTQNVVQAVTPEKKETQNNEIIILQKDIAEMRDKFNKMYGWYLQQSSIEQKTHLIIDAAIFQGDAASRSFKMYQNTLEELKKFSEEYKQYTTQDIVNFAILDMVKRYKKD